MPRMILNHRHLRKYLCHVAFTFWIAQFRAMVLTHLFLFHSSGSRFVQFMTIFNRIRLRMDDGTIDEDEFMKQVNVEAIRAYDKNEINTFIDKLSEQGKVMKSDGNIYII